VLSKNFSLVSPSSQSFQHGSGDEFNNSKRADLPINSDYQPNISMQSKGLVGGSL